MAAGVSSGGISLKQPGRLGPVSSLMFWDWDDEYFSIRYEHMSKGLKLHYIEVTQTTMTIVCMKPLSVIMAQYKRLKTTVHLK